MTIWPWLLQASALLAKAIAPSTAMTPMIFIPRPLPACPKPLAQALISAEPLDLLRPPDRHLQIVHQPVAEGIDPAMDVESLAAGPGILHEDVGGDIAHLAD